MNARHHSAFPTNAPAVVAARTPMVGSWFHAVSPTSVATGFGTDGVYGTKRPARRLDEPTT
jgi:hypothetical protein